MKITGEDLSEHASSLHTKFYGDRTYTSSKLTTTLLDKENYTLHIYNLDLYTRLGMKVKRIHEVISFNQSPFLREWVDKCTMKRRERQLAGDSFGRNFWKLMVNSVFGKFIENQMGRRQIAFYSKESSLLKAFSSPRLLQADFMNESVVKVESIPRQITLNRAIAVGVSILELSKIPMYEFYYDVIQKVFGKRAGLLYMDTDSFILSIESKNPWDELEPFKEKLDTSNFDKKHPLYSLSNASKLGCFKSETGSDQILAFCGLKSKLYSLMIMKNGEVEEIKKGKGVPSRVLDRNFSFDNYLSCLLEDKEERCKVERLLKRDHIIYQRGEERKVMNSFDDKRFLLNCSIHSVPYGAKNLANCCSCMSD